MPHTRNHSVGARMQDIVSSNSTLATRPVRAENAILGQRLVSQEILRLPEQAASARPGQAHTSDRPSSRNPRPGTRILENSPDTRCAWAAAAAGMPRLGRRWRARPAAEPHQPEAGSPQCAPIAPCRVATARSGKAPHRAIAAEGPALRRDSSRWHPTSRPQALADRRVRLSCPRYSKLSRRPSRRLPSVRSSDRSASISTRV